jgi:hypothetical protein
MDVVANGLHALPTLWRIAEQPPCFFAQDIRLAIAAAQEIDQGLRRQVLHAVLNGLQHNRIRHAAIADNRIGRTDERAGRSQDAVAPVAELVVITVNA